MKIKSYQCSRVSTPQSIIGLFEECAALQKNKDLSKFTAVVVLDEVGLAEDSEQMPLKVSLVSDLEFLL